MKKFLTITGISIAVLLLVMLILPFALKGKVADIVKSEGNKMLNAQFDFEELDISLFRHFPSATISLEDFWLKGAGKFEQDTLVTAKELSATVNLFSLFGSGGYEISQILLDNVHLHAIVLEDGAVNWDIVKPSTEAESEEEAAAEENNAFRIQLENLSAEGLTVVYDDRKGKSYAALQDLTATCSGDFGSEQTLLKVDAATPSITYRANGVTLLNKVNVTALMDINADFKNGKYTLKDNKITLNAIEANLNGWCQQLADGWDMDVSLSSNKIGFKEILSLIPGIYTKDFNELKTDGNVTFTAFAKGMLKGNDVVPKFEVKLDVKDGLFKYPSLPGDVNQVNLAMTMKNPGGSLDATTIEVNPFRFTMAGQPFGMNALLKTPVSDLNFNLTAKGKMDLGKIKEVYPMPDTQLNGKIDADVRLSGKMSAIEKERYEDILAEGQLRLNDMQLDLADLPQMKIKNSVFNFSPKILKLSETTVNLGKNDLTVDSQFENYLAFAFQGKTLKGSLSVKSNYLNLNDFMSADTTASATQASEQEPDSIADMKAMKTKKGYNTKNSGLIIPANIDFRMQTDLKLVLLDKMKFENVNGILLVKNQKVNMQNLSMNTMGGKVVANGAYATPKGQQASLNGSFALQNLDFNQTYTELDVVKQLAPIFAGLKGTYSGGITIDSRLDEQMAMDVHTVQGKGNLSTKDMSLSGVKFIDQVATIVKKPELKDIRVKDLNLDFTINDGRVTTQPFDLRLGDYSMNLSGSTGLDQTIDYRGKITLPSSSTGKKQFGTVDMLIKGTFDKPEVSIDMASLAKNIAGQLFDNLTGGRGSKDKQGTNQTDSTKRKKSILDKALDLFN